MVFIIGGKGFVGSAYVRLMAKKGIEHEVIDIDNYDEFIGRSCDVLINANGNSKKFLANREPFSEFDMSVRSVCRTMHDFTFEKYVHCSTCDVYSDFSDPKLSAEDVNIDLSKQSRYGFHKYIAEQFVKYEAKDHIIIRFGGFVGPNLMKNPIFDILNGGPLWVHPESELQYIHTDTAAETVWGLVEKGVKNEIVNVCGNGLVKMQDVIDFYGEPVEVKEGREPVVYNINIEKVMSHFDIPDSKETVFNFVESFKK